MGKEARLNRTAFLKKQPYCIFCGGQQIATTKEHCPPRAFFQHKWWPEGFEFPACEACNNGTGDDDAVVALLGRMDPFHNAGNEDGRVVGLMHNVNKQHPNLLSEMLNMSAAESRRAARSLGIKPPPGLTYQQTGIVNVTEHMDTAVQTLAGKLSKAIYYLETGQIFPIEGQIQFHWFTNTDLFKSGPPPVLEAFKHIEVPVPRLVRNRKNLSDQFDYRYALSDNKELALLRAFFGRAFGFVTISSPVPGKLTSIDAEMQIKTGKESGPFRFL